MPIVLVSKDESWWEQIDGAEFRLRRAPQDMIQRWRQESSTRGKLDEAKFMRQVLVYCVMDWRDGVFLPSGEPAPFTADNLLLLPDDTLTQISDVLRMNKTGGIDPFSTSASGSGQ